MATNTLNTRIQLKGDTAENWASSTLVPLKNEMCIESDTRKVKIGDGVNTYPDLQYINLTPEEVSALIQAANHTHSNKSILDATTASFTSELLTKLNGIATGANKTVVDSALSSTSTNPVQNKVINTALSNKVDKVTGKGLSTNDFDNGYKAKLDVTNVAYGTCTTAGGAAAKEVTLTGNDNWELTPGAIVTYKCSYTNTASNPTLNVNGTGAKSVWYNTALITSGNKIASENRYITVMYDGTQWVWINWSYEAEYNVQAFGIGYGTCATDATTAAKVVTLNGYSLNSGGMVAIKFTNGNTVANPTLNINNRGAKALFYKGAALTDTTLIQAGDIWTVVYDGTQYQIISKDHYDLATTSLPGLISAADKSKLDGIAAGANKYTLPTASASTLGGVKIGSNIAISSGVISVADGTTSAKGVVQLTNSTSSTSTTTAATPASVKSAYDLANTAKTNAATAQSTADSKVGAVSLASGTNNGTVALTVDGTTTDNIAVKGLGSAAYTASSAYATAAQGTKADNAMPRSGGNFTGTVTLKADPTTNLGAATKQYVDTQITSKLAASDAMVFKGTLGTDGTVTAVPTTGVVKGDTYKIITAGTYAESVCKIGDLIIALNSGDIEATATNWAYVPSGNEIETTIKYSKTTQDLTTYARAGVITLAEGATKQVDTTIDAGSTSTNLPTSAAVASFVEGKGYATNSFSNITVGSTTVAADSKSDTLTLAAGSNITITPDATNDKITISSTNTTYSPGTGLTLSGTKFNHSNSVT